MTGQARWRGATPFPLQTGATAVRSSSLIAPNNHRGGICAHVLFVVQPRGSIFTYAVRLWVRLCVNL